MIAVNRDRECELLHTCREGKKPISHIRMMLATAGLLLVVGAIDAAQADDDRDRVGIAALRWTDCDT
jgi:hypothetical protein